MADPQTNDAFYGFGVIIYIIINYNNSNSFVSQVSIEGW